MKVYIASHDKWAALYIAQKVKEMGHDIVSRWIYAEFDPTEKYREKDRERIAKEDADDVRSCDALVLISGREMCPGGKFVEAGIALGLGKRVVVLGHRENMLLWNPCIRTVSDPKELWGAL